MKGKGPVYCPGTARERIYRSLLESANIIFSINSEGRIASISPSVKQFTGYTREELIGQNFTRFIYPQDVQVVRQSIARIGPNNKVRVEFRLICKNGRIRYVRATILAHISCRGVNKKAVTGIITDISGHKKTQEQLRNCALYDSLTGLFNRSCFQKELSRGHPPGNAGIIVCDVDGLKQFNDLFGHSKGDAVLVAAAGMIENCCPSSSLIARTGGDEFAAILYDVREKDIMAACNKLQDTVKEHNTLCPDMPISLSTGYAVDKTPDLKKILKTAEYNMHREKLHRDKSKESAVVKALLRTLEEKDTFTERHSRRLPDLVVSLARAVYLPEHTMPDLKLFAQFHDVGKIATSDNILMKPAPLTAKETKEMRRHSEIGCRIAQSAPSLAPIAKWILKHHEWWNGEGYPLGLQGEKIPLPCRILSICDAYDAMTSNRPYRRAMSKDAAINELRKFSNRQFDSLLVSKFIQLIA